ncbi:MAG TPA: TonB-dependent receptor [Candidatus Acidoferrum sp.]|nr:TonB-dependent receptor [Candidatus Acidoferrum sp.]
MHFKHHAVPSFRLAALAIAITASAWALADDDADSDQAKAPPPGVEEQVIFGRATDLLGHADAASEGSISGADLLVRPMLKTAELLESMPGLVAVQHSGSGKANQYFLRGFNLDHGTDYTARVDDMPFNLRSHGHGQGYLDVNGLIPETVESIDYRKGPYRADLGDFAIAGASFIKTIDHLDNAFVSAETGQYGWRRVASGDTVKAGDGLLTVIGDYDHYDGPWSNPEDLKHLSLWGKYVEDTSFGRFKASLSYYHATWDPTEQVPERAIGTAVCPNEYCSLDPTAKGYTNRLIFNSQLDGSDWNANLYLQRYDWHMLSNPTYDYQIGQFDQRWTMGGLAKRTFTLSDSIRVDVGGEFRYDDIGEVGVNHTDKGVYVSSLGDNAVKEGSVAAFTEANWSVTDTLRLMAGLRGDYYNFDVTAHNAVSSAGEETSTRASPKVGAAWIAADNLELYANWGRGFHSNDARGVVAPGSGVPGLSPGTGYEVGARTRLGDVKLTTSYWWLDQSSELIFSGDSNSVEPKGASKRHGFELTAFWQPLPWLGIDGVYTSSNARFINNPDGDHVEDALEEAAQLGISATTDHWDFSLRARYMGAYALLADNSERANPLTTVNLRAARHWDWVTVYAEVINVTDTHNKEIVYSYPAYVAGVDPPGLTSDDIDCNVTNCRLSRVTEPRTLRVGISYKFH